MSMLAEPRRKQRWSLNPRGKQWSDDSNKFGQRMLEKMGWSSGKGLGAKEQGMTEHVRVKVKNDTLGIGFNESHMEKAWTTQQEGFNELLQQLQKSDGTEVINITEKMGELSGKSLELKSKQSRARVHYQKFTRGKDVNKYSTKDLANIFGQKHLNGETNSSETETKNQIPAYTVGSQICDSGVITIHGGNMTDYFKKKVPNFVENSNKENVEQISNSEEEGTQRYGFGFSGTSVYANKTSINSEIKNETASNHAFDNPCLNIKDSVNITASNKDCEQNGILKTSKKRKKESAFDNNSLDSYSSEKLGYSKRLRKDVQKDCNEGTFINNALDLESQADESHVGREFEVTRSDPPLYIESSNLMDLKNKEIQLDIPKKQKKKLKNSKNCEVAFVKTVLDLQMKVDHNGTEFEVPGTEFPVGIKATYSMDGKNEDYSDSAKKKKRRAKGTNPGDSGFINTALDLQSQVDESHNGKEFEVARAQTGFENDILNVANKNNNRVTLNNQYVCDTSIVKRKKNKMAATIVSDNEHGNDESHADKSFEKWTPRLGINNQALDLTDESIKKKRVTFNDQVEYSADPTNKKKVKAKLDKFEVENEKLRKKNKNKAHIGNIDPVGFVNEALDIEILSEEVNDNAVNEYRSKKIKRKKERRLSNLETIEEAPEEDQAGARADIEIVTLDECPTKTHNESVTDVDLPKNKKKKKNEKEIESTEFITVIDITGDEEKMNTHAKKKERRHATKDDMITKSELTSPINFQNSQKESSNEGGVAIISKRKKKNKHFIEKFDQNEESVSRYNESMKDIEGNKKKSNKVDECKNQNGNVSDAVTNGDSVNEEEIGGKVSGKSGLNNFSSSKKLVAETVSNVGSNHIFEKQANRNKHNLDLPQCQQRNNHRFSNNNHGPWNGRIRMSKHVLKALFHNRSVSDFPGSNMNEIKGYGIDAEGTIQS